MTLLEAKEKIKTYGYCDFDLKEFNEDYYNVFLNYKYSVNDTEYLEKFKLIRFDFQSNENDRIQMSKEIESHAKANELKKELLAKYDYEYMAQLWFQANFNTGITYDGISLQDVYYSILEYFYGQTEDDVRLGLQWTCYTEDCFLKDHNDGQGDEFQNTCAILIYLNEEWDENWGGSLVLRNDKSTFNKNISYKVVPKFGKVAIIDLEKYDVSHMVENIKGDHNRCTMLAFCTQKERRIKIL
jgi:Rps23 Pro-64 3,4-dihydroxylase Tpa1-like proline 4-hydroxylase